MKEGLVLNVQPTPFHLPVILCRKLQLDPVSAGDQIELVALPPDALMRGRDSYFVKDPWTYSVGWLDLFQADCMLAWQVQCFVINNILSP